MSSLPIGSRYSAKGMDAINSHTSVEDLIRLRRAEQLQKRAIDSSVWLPIIAFLLFMGATIWLIAAVCDCLGIK